MFKKINQVLNPIISPQTNYKGFENIYISQPTVFISNHISEEDITLLDEVLPKNTHLFISKKEEHLNLSVLKKRKYTAYNHLNETIIKEMLNTLQNNIPIFFFPENKISIDGLAIPVDEDFINIFNQKNVLFYPIAISGAAYIKTCPFRDESLKDTNGISVSLGSPFYIYESNDILSKEAILHRIYKEIYNHKFESVLKKNVNLYNELVLSVKNNENSYAEIKDESGSISYKNFLISVNVLGTKFEKNFENEDRIGTFLPTSLGYALTLFSLFKAGKTPVLLNFTMGIQNTIDCCNTASLKSIITSKEFIKKANLEKYIEMLASNYQIHYLEDIKSTLTSGEKLLGLAESKSYKKNKYQNDEIILFTSGSESKPKGVILTHDNIYANIQQALNVIHVKPKDKFMNVLPMFHSFGMTVGCILPILFGIDVYLYPSPINYKKIPKLIFEENSTILFATSTFLSNYGNFAKNHFFQTLRYTIAGAEQLKEDVKEMWFEKFGIRIIEGYGVTETSPILSFNRPSNYIQNSVGQLLPGIQFKIEPVEGIESGGNLLVKGPNVMRGYLLHEKGFVPHEGWYRTGDIVEMNETEHIKIKARLKRFAKIGGEMVSLNLVEQIATECFGLTGFAAVSVAEKKKGERIILFSIHEDIKDKLLKKYVKDNKYSNLLLPYSIEKIEEIPILGTGKTNYVALQSIAKQLFDKN